MEFVLPIPCTLEDTGSAMLTWHSLRDRFTHYCLGSNSESIMHSSLLYLISSNEISQLFKAHFPRVAQSVKMSFLQELEDKCFAKLFLLFERFRFFSHIQEEDRKISKFLLTLEYLADLCEFGDAKNQLIRDQIVHGVSCESLRDSLKNMDGLTKKKAKTTCKKFTHPCNKTCCKKESSSPKFEESFEIEFNSVRQSLEHDVEEPSDSECEQEWLQSQQSESDTQNQRVQPRRKVKKKRRKSNSANKLYKTKRLTKRAVEENTVDLSNLLRHDKLITLYDRLTDHLDILNAIDIKDCIYRVGSREKDDRIMKAFSKSCEKDEKILSLVTFNELTEDDGPDTGDDDDVDEDEDSFSLKDQEGGDGKILTLMDSDKDLLKSLDPGDDSSKPHSFLFTLPDLKDDVSETEIDTMFDVNLAKIQKVEKEKKKKVRTDRFNCTFCERGFRNRKVYNKHLHADHRDKHPYKCDLCPAIYMRERNWQLHKQSHTKEKENAICDQCGCVFLDAAKLQRHINRVHRNAMTYECEICHKRLASKDGLVYHLRVHRSERPYVCEQCGAEHVNQGNLNRHIRWRHQGLRPHKCTYCGKGFVQFTQKILHQRRYHTKEAPFSCSQCSSSFFSKYDLKVHMRKHTGERPYKCTICEKDFRIGTHLNRHMQSHNGEKSYSCDLCNSRFSRLSNLRCHKKTVHGNTPVEPQAPQPAVTMPSTSYPTHIPQEPRMPPPAFVHAQIDTRQAAYVHPQMDTREQTFQQMAPSFPHPQFDNRQTASPVPQLEIRAPSFPYPESQWNRHVWFQPL